MDLKEDGLLDDSVADHWYYRAKSAALVTALEGVRPCSVLDVGAGSGFFSRQLLSDGHVADATCIDPGYGTDHDEMIGGRPLLFRRMVEQPRADLVLMMDVLEHVDDDAALLRAYVEPVDRGTHFVLTVPAFSWLWSAHDVFLGHRRRYTLAQLRTLAESAGLVIDQACYFYGLLFPLAALCRLLERLKAAFSGTRRPRSQMRPLNALLNTALWLACRVELPVFRHNRLFGLTAMIVAHKAG